MNWYKTLVRRGWNATAYLKGIMFHNEDMIAANHPLNYFNEDEVENNVIEIMNELQSLGVHIPVQNVKLNVKPTKR